MHVDQYVREILSITLCQCETWFLKAPKAMAKIRLNMASQDVLTCLYW